MSSARSNAAAPPGKPSTSAAPTSASSVLPEAIPSDERTEPAVLMLTRNAPAKIAGHTWRPSSRTATSAMPAGGQTAVALACTIANARPRLPSRTERTPTPSAATHLTGRPCMSCRRLCAGPALHRVRLPAMQPALVEHGGVHAAHRPAAAEHERDLLPHAPQADRVEARRGGRDVRGEDHVVHLEQRIRRHGRLLFQDVEPGARDPAFLQRLDERRLIDGGPAP